MVHIKVMHCMPYSASVKYVLPKSCIDYNILNPLIETFQDIKLADITKLKWVQCLTIILQNQSIKTKIIQ